MENLSKKAPYRSGHYGGAKSVYDDVFAIPPRFGVPSLSPQIEDYAEIFGGSRGFHRMDTSIPMLDLPAADVADVAVSFRGSHFDYLEVFGGSECLEFVVYEELLERSKGGTYDSSDEAWTPAQSETMSEESEPFACTERYQTNVEFHNSSHGTTQFKVSYNKVFHTSEDDVANGLSRVTQLNEVPGYSFLVHETRPPQKMVVTNNLKHEGFSGELREEKNFKKSTSLPNKPFVTVSDISLKTRPSHLPPPSRPPPSLGSKDGDSDSQSSKMKASISFPLGEATSDDDSPLFYDVEVDASSSAAVSAAAMKDVMEKAQAKLKSAKHVKERSKQEKVRGETSERDFGGGKVLAENGRKHGKGLENSSLKNDGNVEWKQDEEFYEVVETGDSRNLFDVIDGQSFIEHNLQNNELRQEKRESRAISHEEVANRKMKSGSEIHEKIIVEAVKDDDFENTAKVWEKEREDEKGYGNDSEIEERLNETLEREDREKIERETREREEKHKREMEARERDLVEKRLREAIEKEEKEKRLKLAFEEKEKKQKEAWEKEEKEKREKAAREKELEEKRLRETVEREEKEKRLRLAFEEKEKKQREARESEEKEKKEKEARKRELEDKRLREAVEKEEKEKRLRLALQLKEKKEREAREREEKEKREKEAHERELEEKRIQEVIGKEKNEMRLRLALEEKEKKQREAREREEKEAKEKEAREREEKEKRGKEAREREAEEKRLQKVLEREKIQKEALEREEKEKREKEVCERELEEKRLREALEKEEKENKLKIALEKQKNEKKQKSACEINEADKRLKVNVSEQPNITLPEGEPEDKDGELKEDNEKRSKEGFGFEHENIDKMWEEINGLDENIKNFEAATKVDKKSKKSEISVSKSKVKRAKPNVVDYDLGEISANTEKFQVAKGKREKVMSSQEVKVKVQGQNTERKGKNLDDVFPREEKEREERISREREMENERLQKIEEEREREREREKDRMAVNMASLEKAAVERATVDARLRAERAAVERVTAEARERAFQKAKAEKAAFETRERAERMRQSSLQSDSFQSAGSSNGSMNAYSSVHGGVEVESAQRCKARLERHQRTAQRAAKALEEKNQRDLLAQRELAERNRLAEGLDSEVKRWSSGKEGNLRALLSTLQYILGPDSGWQPIHLTEVITSAAVKRAYRKATLCVHPDKLQQRGATIHQKYICEKVFDLLKAAWNKFNSEER